MSRWSAPDEIRLEIADIVGSEGPDVDVIEALEERGMGR